MFDENKILQDEQNVQYDFRKTIVEKDEKNIEIKGENKALFKLAKATQRKKFDTGKYAWRWELFLLSYFASTVWR